MTDTNKTTNSASATGDSPDVRVDVQDPLPETDWFWRRTYAFIMSIASLAFVWAGVESLYALQRGAELFYITRWMIAILGLVIVFYMLAPSAEQIVKIIQSARLLRSGVPLTRTATVETPETKTEVTTQAGQPGPPPTRGGSGHRPRSPYVDEE